jgi:vesicle transport through interaction with t-SNAREs protein 1
MELEVRSLDSGTRKELTKKVRQYKASLNSLDEDYQRVKEKEERDGLLGGRDGMGEGSIEMRGRMRSATEK